MNNINTKKVYNVFMVCCIITSVIPMLFAIDIIKLSDYESFYALLDNAYLPYTYISRVLLSNIDYMYVSIFSVLYTLLDNISIINMLMIVLSAYIFASYHETKTKQYFKLTSVIHIIYLIGMTLIAFVFIFGFTRSSVSQVITLFKIAGMVMFSLHLGIIILAIIALLLMNYKSV